MMFHFGPAHIIRVITNPNNQVSLDNLAIEWKGRKISQVVHRSNMTREITYGFRKKTSLIGFLINMKDKRIGEIL